jgi:hypothetical protein
LQWEAGCSVRTDRQAGMTKMTVVFRNFANALKMFFFAITLFILKLICKKIKRKAALDRSANNNR